jgi:rare lipoprotein A
MRRVAGVSLHTLPLRRRKRRRQAQPSVHPTTFVAALTLSALLVAAALYAGEKAARYLPDTIAVTSWQKPRAARDTGAPPPSQVSNRAKKADREPVRIEARLTPETPAPKPETATPAPGDGAAGALPETGRASWYDLSAKTASGEDMDGDQLTAAHPTLPLGSQVRVENLDNGRAVVVRINDRGPFAKDRIIDLSKAAAERLGMIADGVANVRVSPVAGEVASN